jgi:hypothetical protein
MPISRYKILVSTLRLRNRINDSTRFTTAKLQNRPLNCSCVHHGKQVQAGRKIKAVLISRMLKSEPQTFYSPHVIGHIDGKIQHIKNTGINKTVMISRRGKRVQHTREHDNRKPNDTILSIRQALNRR